MDYHHSFVVFLVPGIFPNIMLPGLCSSTLNPLTAVTDGREAAQMLGTSPASGGAG